MIYSCARIFFAYFQVLLSSILLEYILTSSLVVHIEGNQNPTIVPGYDPVHHHAGYDPVHHHAGRDRDSVIDFSNSVTDPVTGLECVVSSAPTPTIPC